MRRKVTIQSIADFTGLSKFAVSRALSNKPGVSTQTRDTILKAAGQLGYFKDSLPAKAPGGPVDLDMRKWSGTIVILFPNVRYQNPESLYWGPVFNGISSRLDQRGINVVTLTEPKGDSLFSLLHPEAIMGVITVGSISTPILLEIRSLGIPVMMVDHADPGFKSDSIFTDNMTVMKELMELAIGRGYTRFQFIGNIRDAESFYERFLVFRAALEDKGISLSQIPALIAPEIDQFRETFAAAVTEHGLPDIFICANDTYALFAIETMEYMGLPVPANLAFTGFDNTYPSLPLLATVNVDKGQLGMRAVDQMLWRILNPGTSFEKILIQADLIIKG
ncbi:transcriptional regulator [Paenibacillus sp. FSL R7-0273]|uniref:LacI family DNA-binding transcriptional regulator n=1 Tax=Paenibacillus sp. FSL R7-0273 TaxID=1536772 RepID=UPI0004F880E5|nr:LacI family DNA-binding transcriptional regulator [Paenibacillus sp. FSL R7-0273]AIQ45138.1 transcriptional regulator [Paenibacillus sp. FSL R7-0273]OMF86619.1 transcriptional regulator [Paenibacillus sp. FSL R7-0273]